MRSTDRGVACLSSPAIPLDHHGSLGPHSTAPDVGKGRLRTSGGPGRVQTDQPFPAAPREPIDRGTGARARRSRPHMCHGDTRRDLVTGRCWNCTQLGCAFKCAPPETQAEALGRPVIELSCRPVGAARLLWPSHSCSIHVWCMCRRGLLEIWAKRSVIYSRGVQMSATDTGWGCPSKHCKHKNGSARGVWTAESAAVYA